MIEREPVGEKEQEVYLKGLGKKDPDISHLEGNCGYQTLAVASCLPAYAFCLGMLLRNDKRLYSQDNTYKLVLHSGERQLQCSLSLWSCSVTDHLFSNLKFKLNVFGWNIPLRM